MQERKRLLVLVGHYPSPYKPYYDTQLIDFIRGGYEVQIVAARSLDATVHEKVSRHRLLSLTQYYPTDMRSAGIQTVTRAALRPRKVTRFLAQSKGVPWRRRIGNALRMAALPAQRPDAIVVHELGVAITFDWLRTWYPRVPMAMYYHGGEVASVSPHDREAAANAFAAFDIVFTNTEFARRQAVQRGCPPQVIRVLPVGFDLTDYDPPKQRAYRNNGVLRLISVGRMSEEKGLVDALAAVRLVVDSGRPRIHLAFVGDGYLRPQLEAEVKKLGLQRHVSFLGALTASEVISELARTDALVLSSFAHGTWAETQACAVQEAMLMKALVITTQTGGVPESIPEAMRPFSVPQRDPTALATAIRAIYDMPPDAMVSIAEEGRAFVAAHYDIRSLNQRLLTELVACSQAG